MSKKQFDFIGKRKLFLLISVAILVTGLITNLFLPTELDINFKGGAIFTYSFTGDVDQSAVTEIAKEYLGEEAEVDFTKDLAGEKTQANFTLVKVPSVVLTYQVEGKADVNKVTETANKIFACETRVEYNEETKELTVDPVELVTDAMVNEFTTALKSTEKDAPVYTLISSNTVSELADQMLADMVTKYGTKLTYTLSAKKVDTTAVTTKVENALVASLGGEGSIDLTLSFDEKAGTLTVVPANGGQSLSADNVKTITASLQEELKDGNVALSAEVHNAIALVTSNSVKATVGKGFFIKCLFAMVLGGIFLTLYIGIRFRKIGGVSAGLFATFALIHDILIAYLVYVVFRIPLDDNFIAVVLTILGYSINGTIVIYDRIRENERKFGDKLTIEDIVNRSVNETVNRNVFTSLTTLIAVVCILVVAKINGLESIISFAFPMAVGILAGFYSSVLLSSPLWAWWRTKKLAKEKK